MKAKAILARLIATLSVLAVLFGASALPATASTFSIAPQTAAKVIVPLSSSVCNTTGIQGSENSDLLPVNRWSDASSDMFSALLSQHHLQNAQDQMSRETFAGGMLQFGNTLFKSATEFTTFAANFCFLDKAGGSIDNIVGSIGKKIFSSEVMAFVIVALLIFAFWSSRRSGSFDFKTILTKLAVIALILFMSIQSTKSTGGGADKGVEAGSGYKPAVGSFGWTLVTANNTLGAIMSAPAAMFENGINGEKDVYGQARDISGNKNPLSCSVYVKAMRKEFKDNYPQNVYGMNAGMPLMMDSMWQEMGLRAFRTSQFGYNLPNPENADIAYDDQAWCRLLEWNAGIPGTVGYDSAVSFNKDTSGMSQDANPIPLNSGDLENGLSQRHTFWKAGLGDSLPTAPGINMNGTVTGKSEGDERWPTAWQGVAFNPGTTNEWQRSLISWSACELIEGEPAGKSESWKIRGDFKQVFEEAKFMEQCASWFRGESDAKKFEFPTTKSEIDSKIAKEDGNPALAKYIATLNGNDNQQSIASAGVYAVSSTISSAAFYVFSGIEVIAKILLGFLIVGLFAGLFMLALPKGVPSGLFKTLKMGVSVILVTTFFGFLLSVIALLSRLMQSLGGSFLVEGSIIHLIWMGLTPVVAIVSLHFVFKLCNVPSPFTLKGASQWATAGKSGLIGGAVGAGLGQMSRGGRRMLSRSDRRALRGGSRKSSMLTRIKNRGNRSVAGEGRVGADGVNRRLFSKKQEKPTTIEGESSSGTGGNKFSARGQIGNRAPSTDKELREKAKNGQFNQLDLQNSGLDTFEAGRGVASNFESDDVASRGERKTLKSAALTERGLVIEESLRNPDLSAKERRALERQRYDDLGAQGQASHNIQRVKHGATATFGAVRRLPQSVRSKDAWKTGAKKVGSGAKRGLNRGASKAGLTLSRKFAGFKADPAGSMSRGAVKLGRVAKTTAKYGAVGAALTVASALTGGVAAPVLLGGIAAARNAPRLMRKRTARVEARRAVVRNHVSQYRSARSISSKEMEPQRPSRSNDPQTREQQRQKASSDRQYKSSRPTSQQNFERQERRQGQAPFTQSKSAEPELQQGSQPTGQAQPGRKQSSSSRSPVMSKKAQLARPAVEARRKTVAQGRRSSGSSASRQLGSLRHAGSPRRIID